MVGDPGSNPGEDIFLRSGDPDGHLFLLGFVFLASNADSISGISLIPFIELALLSSLNSLNIFFTELCLCFFLHLFLSVFVFCCN